MSATNAERECRLSLSLGDDEDSVLELATRPGPSSSMVSGVKYQPGRGDTPTQGKAAELRDVTSIREAAEENEDEEVQAEDDKEHKEEPKDSPPGLSRQNTELWGTGDLYSRSWLALLLSTCLIAGFFVIGHATNLFPCHEGSRILAVCVLQSAAAVASTAILLIFELSMLGVLLSRTTALGLGLGVTFAAAVLQVGIFHIGGSTSSPPPVDLSLANTGTCTAVQNSSHIDGIVGCPALSGFVAPFLTAAALTTNVTEHGPVVQSTHTMFSAIMNGTTPADIQLFLTSAVDDKLTLAMNLLVALGVSYFPTTDVTLCLSSFRAAVCTLVAVPCNAFCQSQLTCEALNTTGIEYYCGLDALFLFLDSTPGTSDVEGHEVVRTALSTALTELQLFLLDMLLSTIVACNGRTDVFSKRFIDLSQAPPVGFDAGQQFTSCLAFDNHCYLPLPRYNVPSGVSFAAGGRGTLSNTSNAHCSFAQWERAVTSTGLTPNASVSYPKYYLVYWTVTAVLGLSTLSILKSFRENYSAKRSLPGWRHWLSVVDASIAFMSLFVLTLGGMCWAIARLYPRSVAHNVGMLSAAQLCLMAALWWPCGWLARIGPLYKDRIDRAASSVEEKNRRWCGLRGWLQPFLHWYTDNFSFQQGRHFWGKLWLWESFEVLVQLLNVFSLATRTDSFSVVLPLLVAIALNASVPLPLLCISKEHVRRIVATMCDAALDLFYVLFSLVALDAADMSVFHLVAFLVPTLSQAKRMAALSQLRGRELWQRTDQSVRHCVVRYAKKDVKSPSGHSLNLPPDARPKPIRVPSARATSHTCGRPFRCTLACVASALCLALLLSTVGRAVHQNKVCEGRAGPVLWQRSSPRIFFSDGLFLPATCNFTAVKKLDVSMAELHSLPEGIELYTALRTLTAEHNLLSQLPAEVERLASSLQELRLAHNRLSELPALLGSFHNLQLIDVSHNRLTALQPFLLTLPALHTLSVHGNPASQNISWAHDPAVDALFNNFSAPTADGARVRRLVSNTLGSSLLQLSVVNSPVPLRVPTTFFAALPQLRNLSIVHCGLSEFPNTNALSRLVKLDLHGNRLRTAPVNFFPHALFPHLCCINLAYNRMAVLQAGMGSWQGELTLAGNPVEEIVWSGLPNERQLHTLEPLDYSKWKVLDLTGSVLTRWPLVLSRMHELSSLSVLRLGGCFADYIVVPPQIFLLSTLEELQLAGSELLVFHPFGAGLRNLTRLRILDLRITSSFGNMSSSIALLSNLTLLELANTPIQGTLPSQMAQLTALRRLDVHSTFISGTLSSQLGALSALKELNLYSTRISGTAPPQLGALTALEEMLLYATRLSGVLPPHWANLTSMTRLEVHTNHLSSTIPTQLAKLPFLSSLRLYTTKLSGTVPTQLAQLSTLRQLYLFSTKLSGRLPSEFSSLSSLEVLDVRYTNVTVPVELLTLRGTGVLRGP